MTRALALALASVFGCGYFPWGPGTVGSLAALAAAAWLHSAAGWQPHQFLWLTLLILLPGTWAADRAARSAGRKDPGFVVIDEVLGQWLTLTGAAHLRWQALLVSFVLFRLFDIWKPFPVRQFEKLPGGTGIVADDLMAGVYGAFILYIGGRLKLY